MSWWHWFLFCNLQCMFFVNSPLISKLATEVVGSFPWWTSWKHPSTKTSTTPSPNVAMVWGRNDQLNPVCHQNNKTVIEKGETTVNLQGGTSWFNAFKVYLLETQWFGDCVPWSCQLPKWLCAVTVQSNVLGSFGQRFPGKGLIVVWHLSVSYITTYCVHGIVAFYSSCIHSVMLGFHTLQCV